MLSFRLDTLERRMRESSSVSLELLEDKEDISKERSKKEEADMTFEDIPSI